MKCKSELEKYAETFSDNDDKRRFEKFANDKKFGDQRNRQKIVNALDDAFKNNLQEDEKSEFPSQSEIIEKTVDQISTEMKEYVGNHEGLDENVQTDILDWADKTATDVEIESAAKFQAEQDYIDNLKKTDANQFFDSINQFEKEYKTIDTSNKKFDMQSYKKLLTNDITRLGEKPNPKEVKQYQEAYFQSLLQSLEKDFNARKAAFEQKLIDDKRKQFLKELYEKIENFKKLEQLLQPFIDDLGHGYLWDMSNSPFRNLGFDILKRYAELLKNDTALQEFADLLGRQSVTSQEVEKQIIDETIIKSEYHPKPAQSGNIVGFEYSNDISRVLPSEVGLLNETDLENLFYFKFVEKQLLSYRYSQNVASTYEEIRQKGIEVSKSKDLTGPIIICVDTSGSMQGTPEQTAKIATFALAKISIKQHRKCFLISFSTGIETLDMSDFKKQNALDSLVGFLNKSFNGGTDATPALRECLRQLKTENYKNSDVLMISDFVIGNLPQDVVSSIKEEQENGTSFYSLVIGESSNNQAIECFDENISYNPYNEVSRQEFYRKIRELAVKKNKDNEQ
ncbi:MAG: VWA domain-containing protein [Bacteroidales bacterium]|nr:VWA domain-containing protein [Bacteroidales bacterium]